MPTLLQTRPEAKGIRGVLPLTAQDLRAQRRITLILTIAPLAAVIGAIVLLWGDGIEGGMLGIFLGFYIFTILGVTLGYHRLFTHRSFTAVRPLRVVLAVAGSMAVEGSVIAWVATHRRHHAYADEFGDPHSPHLALAPGLRGVMLGLWHAHVGWLFAPERTDPAEWAPDMQQDADMVRIDRAFPRLAVASFVLPALLGLIVTGTLWGMLSGFLWGSLVRIFLLHHVTWSVNSICHFYGKETYRARGESRNVWPLSVPSFGEAWHNNHHAFPWSARLGLRSWQIDPGWYFLQVLRALRFVRNLKVPTRAQMEAKILRRPLPPEPGREVGRSGAPASFSPDRRR